MEAFAESSFAGAFLFSCIYRTFHSCKLAVSQDEVGNIIPSVLSTSTLISYLASLWRPFVQVWRLIKVIILFTVLLPGWDQGGSTVCNSEEGALLLGSTGATMEEETANPRSKAGAAVAMSCWQDRPASLPQLCVWGHWAPFPHIASRSTTFTGKSTLNFSRTVLEV